MIKLRIEGNVRELRKFITELHRTGRVVNSVSKFYPNRQNSTDVLNGVAPENEGRVYVELRD